MKNFTFWEILFGLLLFGFIWGVSLGLIKSGPAPDDGYGGRYIEVVTSPFYPLR